MVCHIWSFIQDRGSPRLQDAETLTVVVSDVDDLNPVFEPSSYSVSIYENTTRVGVVVWALIPSSSLCLYACYST